MNEIELMEALRDFLQDKGNSYDLAQELLLKKNVQRILNALIELRILRVEHERLVQKIKDGEIDPTKYFIDNDVIRAGTDPARPGQITDLDLSKVLKYREP